MWQKQRYVVVQLKKSVGCNDQAVKSNLVLDLYDPDTPFRNHVEEFIHSVFSRAYGADLNQFLPQLMALRDSDNNVVSSLGMRLASEDALFLETYLDTPVETVISEINMAPVSREKIMEVGNLASIHRGGLRQLIVALTSFLTGAEIDWVVFTAVPAVQKAFAALDLNLHPVTAADKTRLSIAEQSKWGNYYETCPMVVAGKVAEGYHRLKDLIELEKVVSLSCYIWQRAYAAGAEQRIDNNKTINELQGIAL